MPFENRDELYVRQRRVKVCDRCHKTMPNAVNRSVPNACGSIAGSVLGSMVGSEVLGDALGLGTVGSICGGLGGCVAGGFAGAGASNRICDAIDSRRESLCPECKSGASGHPAPEASGGRLGSAADPAMRSASASASTLSQGEGTSSFVAFGGVGQKLGNAPSITSQNSRQSSLLIGGTSKLPATPSVVAAPQRSSEPDGNEARACQLQEDYALARQLQEGPSRATERFAGDPRFDFGPKLMTTCSVCRRPSLNRGDRVSRKIYCLACFSNRHRSH